LWARFSVPVNELSSNVTLANRAVEEYSSNSNATNTASDTTSFAYGPGGSLIPNAAVGTAYARRVQFITPVQSTDKLTLEVKTAAGNWISFQDAGYGVVTIGGKIYGAYISQVSSSAVDVNFGEGGIGAYSAATYGANGGPWSGLSTYLWRVRKTSGGASVGYPISGKNLLEERTIQVIVDTATVDSQATMLQYILNKGTAFTVTLGTAVGKDGVILKFKNIGAGVVTLDANASETIDGATTKALNQYDKAELIAYNGNWSVI
jgi:hypothetical protein